MDSRRSLLLQEATHEGEGARANADTLAFNYFFLEASLRKSQGGTGSSSRHSPLRSLRA